MVGVPVEGGSVPREVEEGSPKELGNPDWRDSMAEEKTASVRHPSEKYVNHRIS